jgi:hypothetical protein
MEKVLSRRKALGVIGAGAALVGSAAVAGAQTLSKPGFGGGGASAGVKGASPKGVYFLAYNFLFAQAVALNPELSIQEFDRSLYASFEAQERQARKLAKAAGRI